MSTKHRVSAKQRLKIVERAYKDLTGEEVQDISPTDWQEFLRKVQHALYGDLEPESARQE